MPTNYSVSFIHKQKLTKNTYSFFFIRPPTFTFKAGQYIRLILPHEHPDERGASRFFTISSSPHETEHLTVTVKISDSSFKKTLFSLKEYKSVQLFGPIGNLTLDRSKGDSVFMSGGMGITPFRSMISYHNAKKLNKNIYLMAIFSSNEEFVFYDELINISQVNSLIKVYYFITNTSKLEVNSESNRINNHFLTKIINTDMIHRFYIAGPPGMIELIFSNLSDLKIHTSRIITEYYTGY